MATETAEAKRARAAREYNSSLAGCPSRQLLDQLSDKWVALVVVTLSAGPMRYSEVGKRVAGISQKMLTHTLRTLERDGLVTRTVTPSIPPRVDYELTDLGRSLLGPLSVLKSWAECNMDLVTQARDGYDTASAPRESPRPSPRV